jgi:glyoxylase-like metal-dependent hydrolase (beta-lactamase superfamily II)
VQIGRDGVLVVDPQSGTFSAPLLAEIGRLSDNKPVRFVLNTSGDPEHVGGNQAVASSGRILAGGNTRAATVFASAGAPIWAHEGVLKRLTAEASEASAGWPTDTFFVEQKDLFVNGEPVQMLAAPAAHAGGDAMVVFRRTDVVSAGDIYTPDRYPVIDVKRGGSINGLIDALNHLLRLTVPEFNQQGGTLVIPGHGRLSDEADVAEYRDMVTIVRDRIRDMVNKGMTLEQVRAAKPTFDYDGIYGADKGAVFVEQVYSSLRAAR